MTILKEGDFVIYWYNSLHKNFKILIKRFFVKIKETKIQFNIINLLIVKNTIRRPTYNIYCMSSFEYVII